MFLKLELDAYILLVIILKKRRRIFSKWKILLFVLVVIMFFLITYLYQQYKKTFPAIKDYGEMVLLQFTTTVLTHAKQEVFDKSYDDLLIKVNRKADGSIESIDYDMVLAMRLSDEIMIEAEKNINNILAGNYIAKDESRYEKNMELISLKKGIVGYIPFAMIVNNPLLSFLNINLPIRYESFALVFSNVTSEVESYGINHLKIELSVNIRLTQRMILPFYSEIRTIEYSFPIALKIVYGELPTYFFGALE